VIQQSGGCTTYQPTAQQLESRSRAWLEALDCDVEKVLDCLQKQSVDDLYNAIPADGYAAFVPNVDGAFLKDQPRVLFEKGDFSDLSFLVGSNSEEGSKYYDQFTDVQTEDEYHRVLQKSFPNVPLDELCEAYPHDRFASDAHPYQLELSYVFGDGYSTCSTLDSAIRAQAAGADVYVYNFEGVDPADIGDAKHGAELPYVFGTLISPDADERALSEQVQSFWAQFATVGDPDDGSKPTWVPFTAAKPARMNLSSERSLLDKTFRKAECDLWLKYYDGGFSSPQ
jgi:carboxylesterase type B